MKIENWTARRQLAPRGNVFVCGIIDLILMLAVFMGVWYVFMDPRGIMRMYTPMYGYAYVQWLLVSVLTVNFVFQLYPLQNNKYLAKTPSLVKGIIYAAFAVILMLFIVDVVFKLFLGYLAVPYFSEEKLLSLRQNAFTAREYAHQAITMYGGIAALLIPIWVIHMNNWPASQIHSLGGYLTSFFIIFALSGLGFLVFFHPHMGILFYPWQIWTAVVPWWENFADTLSGNFCLGAIMCWTAVLWITNVTFEGYPFKKIKNQKWRASVGILGTLLIAMIFFKTFLLMQELVWGVAIRGSQLIGAVDWRYLHSGECAMFMLLIALIWGFYFNNWPHKYSTEFNIFVRFVIVCVLTFAFYVLYYRYNADILGQQPGYSNPLQYPLAATSLIVALLLMHNWFFDLAPGYKIVNREELFSLDDANDNVKVS
ncbi:MAG: hypothetical protein ACI4NN_07190 [Pyramidobacter sp.]